MSTFVNPRALVVLETPYAPDPERGLTLEHHEAYLRACLRDSINRGEAPFASHRMYTYCLDDSSPVDRAIGISLGFYWGRLAQKAVFYVDLGLSPGMLYAQEHWRALSMPFEHRELKTWDGMPT
jgi:hypothetical protein